jgi:hypothetical protein
LCHKKLLTFPASFHILLFFHLLVYIYGFSKIEGGRCHGAFFHPNFTRGKADLCLTIGRNESGDRRLKISSWIPKQQQCDNNDAHAKITSTAAAVTSVTETALPLVSFAPAREVVASPVGALPVAPLRHLRRSSLSATVVTARTKTVAVAPSVDHSSFKSSSSAANVHTKSFSTPSRRDHDHSLKDDSWPLSTFRLDPFEDLSFSTALTASAAAVEAATAASLDGGSSDSSSTCIEWDSSSLEPRSIEEMQSTPLPLPPRLSALFQYSISQTYAKRRRQCGQNHSK